jgi:hypothetical protein
MVMTAPASSCTHQAWRSGVTSAAFSARKQQALVLLLAQQLIDAQFQRADRPGSERLWQEAAALEIDPERIVHLMYSGLEGSDRPALIAEDDAWIHRTTLASQRRWGLLHLHRNRRPQRPAPSLSPA